MNGKQAVLANASFLDATSSVQIQLNGKANLNGNTYTGTHDFTGATVSGVSMTIADGSLTIAKTSNLQSSLDLKANLNGNTYLGTHDFTGSTVLGLTASSTIPDGSLTIAKTNGLQNALNAKWPIPSNASNLNNVDITSSLTGLLSNNLSDMVFIMAFQPMYNVSGSYTSTFTGGSASLFLQNSWTISSGNQTVAWSFVVRIDNTKLVNGCKYLCIFNTVTDSNLTTAASARATLSIDSGVGNPTTYTSRLRYDQSFRPTNITLLTGFTQSSIQAPTHTPTMFNFIADTTNGTYIKIFCDTKSGNNFLCNFGTFLIYKIS